MWMELLLFDLSAGKATTFKFGHNALSLLGSLSLSNRAHDQSPSRQA